MVQAHEVDIGRVVPGEGRVAPINVFQTTWRASATATVN